MLSSPGSAGSTGPQELEGAGRLQVPPRGAGLQAPQRLHGPGLRRGTFWALILRLSGALALLAMNTVAGRALGPVAYGQVGYTFNLLALLSLLVPLGYGQACVRYCAEYLAREQWSLLRGILLRSHQVALAASLVAAVVLAAVGHFLADPALAQALGWTALLLPLLCSVAVRRRALLGLGAVRSSIFPEDVLLPGLMTLGLLLPGPWTASQALLLYGVAAVSVTLLGGWLLWRALPAPVRNGQPDFDSRAWARVSAGLAVGAMGQALIARSDVMLLGLFQGMQVVGPYAAASRLAALPVFVLGAVVMVTSPMVAAAYHSQRLDRCRSVLLKSALLATLGAVPPFLLCLLFPTRLLAFFGPGFEAGAVPLQVLALGQFVAACTGPAGVALQMSGQEGAWSRVILVVAVLNVLLQAVLVPGYGAMAAAWISSLSVAGQSVAMLFFVARLWRSRA